MDHGQAMAISHVERRFVVLSGLGGEGAADCAARGENAARVALVTHPDRQRPASPDRVFTKVSFRKRSVAMLDGNSVRRLAHADAGILDTAEKGRERVADAAGDLGFPRLAAEASAVLVEPDRNTVLAEQPQPCSSAAGRVNGGHDIAPGGRHGLVLCRDSLAERGNGRESGGDEDAIGG